MDKIPFHPILLGLFPVLCSYTSLISYVLLDEIVLPLLISLALTGVIFGVVFAAIRDVNRAAIVTSAAVLLNIPFDVLALRLDTALEPMGWPTDDRIYLIPYAILAAFILFFLARSKSEFKLLTAFLNLIGTVLIGFNLLYIGFHEFTLHQALQKVKAHEEKVVLKPNKENPDIYYVILDAMGRYDTLKEFYDYDDQPFLDELTKRGFVIPKYSKSNYQMTGLSLPSSLNMEYINFLADIMGKDSIDYIVLFRMVQDNRLVQSLKSVGYRFVNIRSGYSPTDHISQADENIGYPYGNIFHLALWRSTLPGPFLIGWLSEAARTVRNYAFNHPDEVLAQSSPKFVFVHVESPHPPFLVRENGDGNSIDRVSLSEPYTKEKYVDQVKYVQKRLLTFVDKLMQDKKKKVIVLQADHGPAIQPGADGNPTPSYLRERMRIFNSYHFPDGESATIYDGITPVNSFRIVLNKFFDAQLPMLPDECYYSPSALPFQFEKVTDKVVP